ncbi:hypothetical protein ACFXGT_35260 [Streptomyces sp. NPDC059352]|uniref:hypothetical protein n=1 Tax=Streptomyces sp. NPDC059352 TaxID=3346810 RepID=UPI0036738876
MRSHNRRRSATASAAAGPKRASRFAVASGPHPARVRPLVGEFGHEGRNQLGAEVIGEDVRAEPGQPL